MVSRSSRLGWNTDTDVDGHGDACVENTRYPCRDGLDADPCDDGETCVDGRCEARQCTEEHEDCVCGEDECCEGHCCPAQSGMQLRWWTMWREWTEWTVIEKEIGSPRFPHGTHRPLRPPSPPRPLLVAELHAWHCCPVFFICIYSSPDEDFCPFGEGPNG